VPKAAQQMDLYAYSSSNKSGRLMADECRGQNQRQIPARHHTSGIWGSRPDVDHAPQLQESKLHRGLERVAHSEIIRDRQSSERASYQ